MADETLNPGNLPLAMQRGAQFGAIVVQLLDAVGAAVPLTGYTPRWIARTEVESPNEFDLNATLSDAAQGKVQILVSSDDTQRLFPVGEYVHGLTLTDGSGNVFPMPVTGPLTVFDIPPKS